MEDGWLVAWAEEGNSKEGEEERHSKEEEEEEGHSKEEEMEGARARATSGGK